MSMADTTSLDSKLRLTASDVMTRDVVSVRKETPIREIARRLLEKHISAAPVVDDSGAPIGMVSEGDLIGRDEADRQERLDWWLSMLAEGEQLAPEFLSTLRRPDRTASDVMTKPVVTIVPSTDIGEIARLFQSYRIKRAPVVQDGKIVGIVSRENLLRALADEQLRHEPAPEDGGFLQGLKSKIEEHFDLPHHEAAPPHITPKPNVEDDVMSAADFQHLVDDHMNKELEHRQEARRGAAEERRRRLVELIDHHITDGSWHTILHRARVAAENGEEQLLLLRFPNQLCRDGGRAINALEPDWPATLRGEAAEVYLRWERDLKPRGFQLTAQVLEFPDGIPGDIGLFLAWK